MNIEWKANWPGWWNKEGKKERERNDRDVSVTNSILVIKVGLRLNIGLEFVFFVADVHPLVLHDGLERGALGRIEHEELLEEVLAVGRHVERYAVFASQDALAKLFQVLAVEWQASAHQSVQDNAQTPDVYFGTVVFLTLE